MTKCLFLKYAPLASSLLLMLIAIGVYAHAATPAHYKRMSVCEILSTPNKADGLDVAIDAELVSARPHGVVLVDRGCPGKGLRLDFSLTGSDKSVKYLEKAIRNGDLTAKGRLSSEVSGRFSGKMELDPVTKRAVLLLRSVQNLQPDTSPISQQQWAPEILINSFASILAPMRPTRRDTRS